MHKTALIGCGRIGKMHHQILSQMDEVCIKYIVDDSLDEAFNTSAALKKIANLEEVLKDKDITSVIIAASSSAHVELIHLALDAGKHVFCEKPVSFDIAQLESVKVHIDKSGLKFQVGLNRRFDADFTLLKEALDEGKLGKVHLIKITNRDPLRPDFAFASRSGGLFFDFNSHDFDMVHFLTGKAVKEIYAIGNTLVEPKLKAIGDIDSAIISIKLEDDSFAVIDASRETHYGYDQRVEVFGEKGMLSVDNITSSNTLCVSEKNKTQSALPLWDFAARYNKAYQIEFNAFFRYLNDEITMSPASIDAMIAAVKVAEAAQQSYRTEQCVLI